MLPGTQPGTHTDYSNLGSESETQAKALLIHQGTMAFSANAMTTFKLKTKQTRFLNTHCTLDTRKSYSPSQLMPPHLQKCTYVSHNASNKKNFAASLLSFFAPRIRTNAYPEGQKTPISSQSDITISNMKPAASKKGA